jgi:hypothetical protein
MMRVALIRKDVSEKYVASIFRVTTRTCRTTGGVEWCRCKRLSTSSVVRHVLVANWKDRESCYPEDGGDMFLRNVGSSYYSHTAS